MNQVTTPQQIMRERAKVLHEAVKLVAAMPDDQPVTITPEGVLALKALLNGSIKNST